MKSTNIIQCISIYNPIYNIAHYQYGQGRNQQQPGKQQNYKSDQMNQQMKSTGIISAYEVFAKTSTFFTF